MHYASESYQREVVALGFHISHPSVTGLGLPQSGKYFSFLGIQANVALVPEIVPNSIGCLRGTLKLRERVQRERAEGDLGRALTLYTTKREKLLGSPQWRGELMQT